MPFSPQQWQTWQQRLQQTLTTKRYQHSLAVQQEAMRLARHWGVDEEKAALAGLLHDVARGLSVEELQTKAKQAGLTIGTAEQANPLILHAPVGAIILQEDWGIDDQAVLDAVRYHTIASPEMDQLSIIIYLADLIEPNRQEWPGLAHLRKLALENLHQAMVMALENSFIYLRQQQQIIHPQAYQAYQHFQNYAK